MLILGSISCLSYAYDLNNDGYGDIVISNYNYNANHVLNSYVYWGDGTGSYTNKIELPTNGSYANSVTDLNSDGYLDIIFSNYYNNSSYKINSYIYWGDATASYTTKLNFQLLEHWGILLLISTVTGIWILYSVIIILDLAPVPIHIYIGAMQRLL